MIQITPQMRILLAVEPADFRKGIDGLARICRKELEQELEQEPFSGTLFVFRNRTAKALKLLTCDGQGFRLCQKRLSQGRFTWWPQTGEEGVCRVDPHQLHLLLWNGDPSIAQTAPIWRPVESTG